MAAIPRARNSSTISKAMPRKFDLEPTLQRAGHARSARRRSLAGRGRREFRDDARSSSWRPAGPIFRSRRAGRAWTTSAARSSIPAPIATARPMSASARWWSASAIPARRSRSISAEAGADVTLSVRSSGAHPAARSARHSDPDFAIAQRFLPARVADALNAPIVRLAVGSIDKLGLKTRRQGADADDRGGRPRAGARHRRGGENPRRARSRCAARSSALRRAASSSPRAATEPFDAVILATGFKPDLRALLPDAHGVLDADGRPLVSDQPTAQPGLYFVGAIASPTGQLRQIRIGATRVVSEARRFLKEERTSFAGRAG